MLKSVVVQLSQVQGSGVHQEGGTCT